ncbi:hypothetical protein [Leptospira licerasiae]|uniref:hypothetical protein n=1 Tax=Leptospira licerasiae TaxID=447106 RepID=UPI00301AAB10
MHDNDLITRKTLSEYISDMPFHIVRSDVIQDNGILKFVLTLDMRHASKATFDGERLKLSFLCDRLKAI